MCVCLFSSLSTSVLFFHAPSLIVFLLLTQISLCLLHLFSPLFPLFDFLSLYMKQRHIAQGVKPWLYFVLLIFNAYQASAFYTTWKLCILAGPSSPSGTAILNAPFRPHLGSAPWESSTQWSVLQYWVRSAFKAALLFLSSMSCCSSRLSWYFITLSMV